MAFRELSAGMPECYAVVGQPHSMTWSRLRTRAFRDVVRAAGAECLVFQPMTRPTAEMIDSFVERLVAWIAGLPEHCAVFAVSDVVAILVERAARSALRNIPRSITLVSVDNIEEFCENADPPISSIQLDFERMGFLAATALGDEIAGRTRFRAANADARKRALPIFVEPFLIVRRKSTSGGGRHEKFILDAVETIRRKAADGLTATELMGRYPVSKSLFNLRFREATGHSVHDEILHVRLEKAFTLLAQTDTAIGAIPGERPYLYNDGETYSYVTAMLDGNAKTATVFDGTAAPDSGAGFHDFGSGATLATASIGTLTLGAGNSNGNNLYGTLKSFRYYERALSDSELLRNRIVDGIRYDGALPVTNIVVAAEGFTATPAPGAYFVEGSYEFTATAGADGAPTGYRLQDWDEATGQWTNPRNYDGTSYNHDDSVSAAKVKLTWCKRNPFVITLR